MAKIDLAALARQYLEEADKLREKYDALARQTAALRGEEALRSRRRMLSMYDMYLECRTTGHYLQHCAGKETNTHARTKL